MSLSKTLPCHLDSLMEMLNIPWPLTPQKKISDGHQMCFLWKHVSPRMHAVFYSAYQVQVSPFSPPFLRSHPSLPGGSGSMNGSHAEKHKAQNTDTLIGALSVKLPSFPLAGCSHTGPPVAMLLFDEAWEKGKDSKQRGCIIISVPPGDDN